MSQTAPSGPGTPVPSSLRPCLVPASAVESLYMALKSIDRMDIVNVLEGQPPQPARQGPRDPSRRPHDREHLSPGVTNGEFRLPSRPCRSTPTLRNDSKVRRNVPVRAGGGV